MRFLTDNCFFSVLNTEVVSNMAHFYCGDTDLDNFFQNEAILYSKQLLGKSYCFRLEQDPTIVVCAFTVANASMRVDFLPNARKKKISKNIPHQKEHKVGCELMDFIKSWFVDPLNKTGCRFVIVDAYNNEKAIAYYKRNNFESVFSSEEQERNALGLSVEKLDTRFMFFDLITIC